MKAMKVATKVMTAVIMVAGFQANAGTYKLDQSHGEIGFSVKHLMISNVKGFFKKFDGSFEFDEAKKTLKNINIDIEVASIDTNEAKRDDHLRSADFFDTAKHAKMTFKGDKAEFKDGKPVKVSGTLTIRGVSKPVTLDVEYLGAATDPWGNARVGYTASTKINRKDFGLNWNKAMDSGGVVVGDEVTIKIEGEGIAQKK